MQLNLKKVVRPLDLGEHAKEYAGQVLQVWVNPTLEKLRRREDLDVEHQRRISEALTLETAAALADWIRDVFEPAMQAWFADLWSQHPDPATHWTVAELQQLRSEDPALLYFMNVRSTQMINEHRRVEKKS